MNKEEILASEELQRDDVQEWINDPNILLEFHFETTGGGFRLVHHIVAHTLEEALDQLQDIDHPRIDMAEAWFGAGSLPVTSMYLVVDDYSKTKTEVVRVDLYDIE